MLVLARSAGQSVVLDERITVTVVATHGGIVRLGIAAPQDVGVRRGELELHARPRRPAHGRDRSDAASRGRVDVAPVTADDAESPSEG